MFRNFCNLTSPIVKEACVVNLWQVIVTSISCLWLFIVGIYVFFKYGTRSYFMPLRFHSVRSAVELLLFIVGTLELASALLPEDTRQSGSPHYVQIPFRIAGAALTLLFAVSLGIYHYVVEIKNYPGLIAHSIFIEALMAIIRIYKLVAVFQDYDALHLEASINYMILSLTLLLGSISSYILYKERHRLHGKIIKDESEKRNIGYKHTTAPFLSKVVFWWLNPLLWKGYKAPLEQEDIGILREEDSARSHYDQFLFIYKTEKAKCAQLWLCYLKSSWKLFILGGLLKLLGDLSALVGPLSIYQIVEYIEEQQQHPEHKLHKDSPKAGSSNISVSIGHWGPPIRSGFGAHTNIVSSEDAIQDAVIYYPGWGELLSNGWVIAWFVLLSSLAQGALSQAATHVVNMIGIRIKTSLQGLVYRKMLLLSSSCLYKPMMPTEASTTATQNESGEANSLELAMSAKDVGAITNLMSEDALNVMTFFWIAHYVWSIPLKVGLVMYLLYLKLGVSAIIGSLVCILTMVPLQFLIGKGMSNNAEKAAECSDQRLRKTNDVFLGIKIIKLNAWEKVFQEKISQARNKELKYLNRDSIYWFLMTTLAHISSVLITFVTLAVFIKLETDIPPASNLPQGTSMNTSGASVGMNITFRRMNLADDGNKVDNGGGSFEFTASRLFSALALFNQLTVPLFIFPITVPIIISAIVSTRRLERFLHEPEVEREFEGIRNMARILSKSDASLDMYESSNEPSTVETTSMISYQVTMSTPEPKTPPPSSKTATNMEPLARLYRDFHSLPKKKTEIVRNSRVESVRLRQKSAASRESIRFSASENTVASFSNAIFTWDAGNTELRVDHLEIPKAKLTIIVGRSGSGKTSLASALLKEMHLLSGDVAWNKYTTIAYVPQTPWLLSSTIRENILFGESYRPKRYEKVLEACALKPDLELMPAGDMTVIDERGINLSGGQKQRVVIARALYSSANFIIMDDPLSSLDNEVAKHVYDNSIKKMFLRAGRTIVMATQRLNLVYSADYIVAMKDCRVEAVGTFSEIERKHPRVVTEWSGIMSTGSSTEQISSGKTARERWRLFKHISKLGLQKTTSNEREHVSSTQSLRKSQRRQSLHGSLHLTYEMPLPIDECHDDDLIILRRECKRNRKCHSLELAASRKGVLRVNSLQPQSMNLEPRTSVTRIVSSPMTLYETRNKVNDGELAGMSGFRQFLNRMSSRRSYNDRSIRTHKTVRLSNSIQSITEEAHLPVSRLVSDSSNSSVLIDDESVADLSDNETEDYVNDEERKYGEVPVSVYWYYLKSCGIPVAVLYFLAALIWQCIRVYIDFWLRNWTDDSDPNTTMYYFQMYVFISNVCIVISLISTSAGQIAGCKARKKLHNDLLEAILGKSFYFFQTSPLGRILNRFSHDTAIVDKKIAATIQRLLQFMLLCLFAVLINTSITSWFIVLTVPICAVYYLIQKFYRCSSRELQRIENITNSPVLSHFTETIQGVTTIRAYNQEPRFTEILFKKLEAHSAAFIILNTSNRWLGVALDYLGGVIVFIAIVTALLVSKLNCHQANPDGASPYRKESPANLSASMVGMAINYTLFIPIYLNWVVKLLADMEMYIGAVERIAYYGEPEENASPSGKLYTPVPISWPSKSDVVYQNVSLRYEGQQNQYVIKNLTLTIEAGQRIGICGRTGSGKSSLVLSLFGVLQVVEGQILIDGVDITTVNPDEIRSRLSIIPQDVHLFNATIRENLDPRGYYNDLQLWNCLELAQLKDVVKKLPLGIETEIIDGGCNLSAGQRQLFCLARAILRGSVCLILDEATSSLDSETETALLSAADHAFKGRTIITIAHRLTTILNYDRIIVLENGEIIEDGSPSALQSIPDGKFATMLKSTTT